MSKHNGNFDVYGILTVGAAVSGSQYSFPTVIGGEGDGLMVVGGDVVFTNPAPYIDIAQTSGGSQLVSDVEQIKDFIFGISGNGIYVKEGTNATMGSATLVAGNTTISTTAVTANSRIFLTSQVDGGTVGFLRVSSRTAGTSFVITSSSATDTSTVAWIIIEPS
jgi:hypothetical protein